MPLAGRHHRPQCGNRSSYRIGKRQRWTCAHCRYQVSLTAGTILHNTKTPLTGWFWAAYLVTTDKGGVSVLLLHRQLGLRLAIPMRVIGDSGVIVMSFPASK